MDTPQKTITQIGTPISKSRFEVLFFFFFNTYYVFGQCSVCFFFFLINVFAVFLCFFDANSQSLVPISEFFYYFVRKNPDFIGLMHQFVSIHCYTEKYFLVFCLKSMQLV